MDRLRPEYAWTRECSAERNHTAALRSITLYTSASFSSSLKGWNEPAPSAALHLQLPRRENGFLYNTAAIPPPPSMINLLICRLQCRGSILHIVSLYLGASTSCGCFLKPFEPPHGGFSQFYLTRISTLTLKISFARDLFFFLFSSFIHVCNPALLLIVTEQSWKIMRNDSLVNILTSPTGAFQFVYSVMKPKCSSIDLAIGANNQRLLV